MREGVLGDRFVREGGVRRQTCVRMGVGGQLVGAGMYRRHPCVRRGVRRQTCVRGV